MWSVIKVRSKNRIVILSDERSEESKGLRLFFVLPRSLLYCPEINRTVPSIPEGSGSR
jgi:hypothetical protein